MSAFSNNGPAVIFGIDISHNQGKINYAALKANNQPLSFVMVKATEGLSWVDPLLSVNGKGAAGAGFPVGYYHYGSLNSQNVQQDAYSEAMFFLDSIKSLPKPLYPLALDLEENPGKLTKKQVLLWVNTFFSVLDDHGFTDALIYSFADFLNINLPPDHGINKRLWVASYTPAPTMPIGWERYFLWQYTDKGKLPGILTNVDLSRG